MTCFFNFYDINYLFGVFHLIFFFFKKPLRILLHLAWPPLQKFPGSATAFLPFHARFWNENAGPKGSPSSPQGRELTQLAWVSARC